MVQSTLNFPGTKNIPKQIQLSEPVLICYRMIKRCLAEDANVLLFQKDKIERRTIEGEIVGFLRTPKPFAKYMLHILEKDPLVAAYVKDAKGKDPNTLEIILK